MRINLLTSFAAGVLITTTICGAVYFSEQTDSANKGTISVNDMKSKLTAKGYIVQTKSEYDKNTNKANPTAKTSSKESGSKKDNKSKPPVTQTVVTVSDGMTSYDVGKMLLDAKMITKDAFSFSKDIEARGLQNALRPGQYQVNSGMSYDEIIATIFKQ